MNVVRNLKERIRMENVLWGEEKRREEEIEFTRPMEHNNF